MFQYIFAKSKNMESKFSAWNSERKASTHSIIKEQQKKIVTTLFTQLTLSATRYEM